MYYMNYFFIFSILGHFLETFIYANGESGILFGWWTPVYGIGVIIILGIHSILDKHISNQMGKAFSLFLVSAIVLSIIEAIGGYLIELIFETTFWDYSSYRFHIGKYAALEMALIWGLCSITVIYLLKPFLDKIVNKIPKFFPTTLSILLIVDLLLTFLLKN